MLFCVLLVWDHLCFLYVDIYFLLSIWEMFSHDVFKYVFYPLLSLPVLKPPIMFIDMFYSSLYISFSAFFPFFFFLKFFSVYGSIWMIFIILSSRSLFWITYAHRRVCHFINYSLHLDCCLSQKWNYQFLIPSSLWFLVPCLMISVYIANLSFHLAFLLPTLKI